MWGLLSPTPRGREARQPNRRNASSILNSPHGSWAGSAPRTEKDNPHMQELIEEGKLFEMHLPYHADGLDALEGAVSIHKRKTLELAPTETISYEHINETNQFRM